MSVLVRGDDGRFELEGRALHCGDVIEIRVGAMLRQGRWHDDVWIRGRVEHSLHGYYFFNPDGPSVPLYAGMHARLPEGDPPRHQPG
jgi:hypothetical protein